MASTILFGPASIYYNDAYFGKTFGGGALTIKTITEELVSSTYDVEEIPYAIEGTINAYELNNNVLIEDTLDLYAYGQIDFVINGSYITLYNCKLSFPKSFSFGTSTQQAFTLTLLAIPDSDGRLMFIDNETEMITTEFGSYMPTEDGTYIITE